jgi:hypothetical protein
MKRIEKVGLAIALTAGLSWFVAANADSVQSQNVVGMVTRELPPDSAYIMVGVNLKAVGNTSPTLKDIVGTNQLRAASNYLNADRVMLWDAEATAYRAFALWDGDLEFYPCNNATEWEGSSPTNPVVSVGQGFWIVSASGSSTTNTLRMAGEAVLGEFADISVKEGYQLMAWPFSSDKAIADIDTTELNAAANYLNADRIVVWEGSGYQNYGLFTDGKWYPCNTATEWEDAIESTDRVISLGEGFWFISQTDNEWTERSGYYDNL